MSKKSRRIMIVDDNHSIHEDLKAILLRSRLNQKDTETKKLEDELFDRKQVPDGDDLELGIEYIIDDAYQGNEAIEKVKLAEKEGQPYSLIFMDVRMPPGIDGIQTIHKIWNLYPHIEVVICTAYSDYSWDKIIKTLGSSNHLFFLKKPFESVTVRQLTLSLTNKWNLDRKNNQYIQNLEREIEKRGSQLKNLMSHLSTIKSDSARKVLLKNSIIDDIRSELQTPLNGILGMTDLLLDTDLDADQRDYTQMIKSSGNSMNMIISDALNDSPMDAETISINDIKFNLRTAVENVADCISMVDFEKDIELTILVHSDVPEFLSGDPALLRNILLKIISNKIRYLNRVKIIISVSKTNTMDSGGKITLHFEIAGTHPEQKNLNLDVSKPFVEMLNGNIGVEDDEDRGKIIWFTAEFGKVKPIDYKFESYTNTITGMRFLSISDNMTNSKVLSLYIKHWGGKCSIAETKESAIDQLLTSLTVNPFDMVILEFKDGEIERFGEYAQTIRHHKPLEKLPLICISGNASRGDAKLLQQSGFSAFLSKPIRQSHLYNCILMLKEQFNENSALKNAGIITKHFVDELTSDKYWALLVDDNKTSQQILANLLGKLEIRCDVAENGKQALEAYSNTSYDLILLDCQMPVMDGYETARAIRKMENDTKKHIPILAVSSDDTPENHKKCMDSGMDDFINVPYEVDNILKLLKKYLNKIQTL